MRAVTLEEISAATRISVRFLEAVEAEEFSKLPGGIFTRSFIRAYAKYLGLDEERILAEFQLIAGPREDFNPKRLNLAKLAPRVEPSRSPIPALLLAAALLGGGYELYRHSRRSAGTPVKISNSSQGSATPSPTPPAVADQSQRGTAPPTTPPSKALTTLPADSGARPERKKEVTSGASTLSPTESSSEPISTKGLEGNSGLVLQVAATERVWVGVDSDGKTALQRVLNANEVETLKAKQFFDVTIGNAEGIVLTLNGETLKSLGRRGEVKSIHLTHDDLKNPAR